VDFGLERDMPKRTYAVFVVLVLLSLGVCLASASPEKLFIGAMRRESVYTYDRTMGVVNGVASAGEINESRTRERNIFAFGPHCADVPLWRFPIIFQIRANYSAGILQDLRGLSVHGSDMVARK
jgi:hypothetical protein